MLNRKNLRLAVVTSLIILVGFFIYRQSVRPSKGEKLNEAKMLQKFGKKLNPEQRSELASYIESVNAQSITKKKKRKLIKEKRASFKKKSFNKKT